MKNNNGDGAPLFRAPDYEEMHYVGPNEEYDDLDSEEEPEATEEGTPPTYVKHSKPHKKLRPELPEFVVVPHFGKGKVIRYDGEGYFLVKVPKKPQLLVHRQDLKFLKPNKAETPPPSKHKKKGQISDQDAKAS